MGLRGLTVEGCIKVDAPIPVAKIGEHFRRGGKMRKIAGYAYGEDGKLCYVSVIIDRAGAEWRTYLTPCEEVEYVWEQRPVGGGE